MLNQIYSILETEDSFKAIDYIEKQGNSIEVAEIYSNLVREIYNVKKDLTGMILVGRAGIQYCLAQASSADGEQAAELKLQAKIISYNVSANAWPGWNDPGIEPTRSDIEIGLDTAKLNLRLAKELNRPAGPLADAYWLLGAQHLALRQFDTAIEQFSSSVDESIRAEKKEGEHMARGYIGIARIASRATNNGGEAELANAVASLNELGTDDARFFAQQLDDVAKQFASH